MLRKRQAITGALFLLALAALLFHVPTTAQAPPPGFANFEGSQTNPIRLSADGTRLFAVNTPNATVSVFDVTQAGSPKLLAEIPVGLEPVSVNPVTDDLAWVVNQISDSISVISVSKGIVTHTINLKALSTITTPLFEPMDVVFAGTQAYVSLSRFNQIAVLDQKSLGLISILPVFGGNPRSLAVSPDGSKVYAAFAISGNATTVIAPAFAPPQSPPTNPSLPPPPQVGLIVTASDPLWKSRVHYTMPDNDVVAIATGSTPSIIGYYSGVGTINMGLGVNPVTGDLFVANTDALNLTHFETNLCGHYVNNRITRISVGSGQITPFDLNPNVTYGCNPNSGDLSMALAQPTNVVFDPSGNFMYVASFGTDRVARVDTNGNVQSFVEVAQASGAGSNVDPANKRGPRGLALNASANTLYALNRLTDSISVIDTAHNRVSSEIPVGNDPTPTAIKQGRGFLYDAKLSGTGTGSCASCHVDGDMDHLAWDLGDPSGTMTTINQGGTIFIEHPMKGPMTTQTLRGLVDMTPYHWRGDKPVFASFNGAFPGLMGGNQLSDSDMATYTTFANNILFQPNPYQNLDRSLPTGKILGGDPATGENVFLTVLKSQGATCASCHTDPGTGSNRTLKPTRSHQPMKIPQLRNIYQKLLFNAKAASTIDGFGLDHDGHISQMTGFLEGFPAYSATEKTDMSAYEVCFDTGTAPAVGYTRTLQPSNVTDKPEQKDWATLQSQAAAASIDLIARGTIQGQVHGLIYQPASDNYLSDTGATYTQAQLQAFVKAGDTISIMGVYPGTGTVSSQARVRR